MTENKILEEISSTAVPQQQESEIPTQQSAEKLQNVFSQTGSADVIRQTALKDLSILSNLMKSGVINPVQGQHLISYVLNKAQETLNNQNATAALLPQQEIGIVSGIADFETENPDFFKQNGRNQVLEYLKNSETVVDKDEILRISQMIEALEQSAIEGYLQKQAHEKSLKAENETAKQKLRANAQNPNMAETSARIFTREQIGKMSGAEYAKNEKAIMEQLRKGLIR